MSSIIVFKLIYVVLMLIKFVMSSAFSGCICVVFSVHISFICDSYDIITTPVYIQMFILVNNHRSWKEALVSADVGLL